MRYGMLGDQFYHWMLLLLEFFLQIISDVYDNLLLVANVFIC